MHKLLAALAVVSALGFAGSAIAAPLQLTDNQLDTVTAGHVSAHAFAGTSGAAGGNTGSGTLQVSYAHATGDSAVAVGGVLSIGIGSHSFAAGSTVASASASSSGGAP